MNSNRLNGLTVLSIDDGKKIGTVSRAYVDREQKRVAGFAYTASGGFMKIESEPKVDATEVRSLGPDALTLANKQAAQGRDVSKRFNTLLVLEELTHRPVLSKSGTSVGQIASINFDDHNFNLTRIEVSPGMLQRNHDIPIDKVAIIGPDYVIVDDSVVQVSAEPTDSERSEPVITAREQAQPETQWPAYAPATEIDPAP